MRHLLILFAVVSENEILQLILHFDPLLRGECGPDVMWLSDGGFVRLQSYLRLIVVHMKSAEDEDQARKRGIGADGLEPVIIKVK